MELKLTRRRFGQLAIASTAVAGLGYLANKTLAQDALTLIGARPNSKVGQIEVLSLNLGTGDVLDIASVPIVAGEKLSGLTTLTDGTTVLAISPIRAGKKETASSRLVFLGTSTETVTLSGLRRQQTLQSLVGLNDGSLNGLVIRKNNRPPVFLANINRDTGEVTATQRVRLPSADRFSNIAQTANGTIYSTIVTRRGNTRLVRLDLGQKKPVNVALLSFNGEPWIDGSADLAYSPLSPGGEILALAAPRYTRPFRVYTINTSNGNMSLVRAFNVAKIAAAPV